MTKIKKASRAAGKLKVWQSRLATYISMVNFAMIFYLYIIQSPMGMEWYHWLIIIVGGTLSIVFIDTKFIMPAALEYGFEKNPQMVKLKRQVEENSEKLDLILTNLGVEYKDTKKGMK